jgi:hypothetical protein
VKAVTNNEADTKREEIMLGMASQADEESILGGFDAII